MDQNMDQDVEYNIDKHALIDMGSNGIRLSITDMQERTARIIPIVYHERSDISLYDAQHATGAQAPISAAITNEIIAILNQFKETCKVYGVPPNQIQIVATEATRSAINSAEYCATIETATGWPLELLPKEKEGRVGAIGIASSFHRVNGIVMDLGGGSVQLTWMRSNETGTGEIEMSSVGSVSLPYGAAALTMKLKEAEKHDGQAQLRHAIKEDIQKAVRDIGIPEDLGTVWQGKRGIDMYLSGGGFRGWGYFLMSQIMQGLYPIPIINGFTANAEFSRIKIRELRESGSMALNNSGSRIFRISKRRASQIPAVAFLLDIFFECLPPIRTTHFSQGGVREGMLYSNLEPHTRSASPLLIATRRYEPPSAIRLGDILLGAISEANDVSHYAEIFLGLGEVRSSYFAYALSNLMYLHGALPKDARAGAALRCTTSGELAHVHGLSHEERALVGVALCYRWGMDISDGDKIFMKGLCEVLGGGRTWWAKFMGVLAAGVASAYPAGVIPRDCSNRSRFKLDGIYPEHEGRVRVNVELPDEQPMGWVQGWVKDLEKLGKRKNWYDEWGMRVEVNLQQGRGGRAADVGDFLHQKKSATSDAEDSDV